MPIKTGNNASSKPSGNVQLAPLNTSGPATLVSTTALEPGVYQVVWSVTADAIPIGDSFAANLLLNGVVQITDTMTASLSIVSKTNGGAPLLILDGGDVLAIQVVATAALDFKKASIGLYKIKVVP